MCVLPRWRQVAVFLRQLLRHFFHFFSLMIQILNLFQTLFLQRQSFALFLKKRGKALPFFMFYQGKGRKKIVVTFTQYFVCVVVVVSPLLPQRRDVASFFSSSKKLCSCVCATMVAAALFCCLSTTTFETFSSLFLLDDSTSIPNLVSTKAEFCSFFKRRAKLCLFLFG